MIRLQHLNVTKIKLKSIFTLEEKKFYKNQVRRLESFVLFN